MGPINLRQPIKVFQDLQSELNDISTIDMANIKSYAIEKGITIDYDNTLNTLQYKNFVLDKDYKKEHDRLWNEERNHKKNMMRQCRLL